MAITRKAEILSIRWPKGEKPYEVVVGHVWLEDGEIQHSRAMDWVHESAYVREAATPEEGFERLIHWSNGYIALREVEVE